MKRVPALRDLSDDHHTALVLARRCKRVERPDSAGVEAVWRLLVDTFAVHLAPHFRIEEEHLLPALEALGEGALAERIREDHDVLRELASAPHPDSALVQRFGERLERHVRFEEREVFEATQDRLPESTLAALAEACRTIPRACPAGLLS